MPQHPWTLTAVAALIGVAADIGKRHWEWSFGQALSIMFPLLIGWVILYRHLFEHD